MIKTRSILCSIVFLASTYWSAVPSWSQSGMTPVSPKTISLGFSGPKLYSRSNLTSISGEPLLIFSGNRQKLRPWLVDKFSTTDKGLIWRFTIREDVKWSDGQTLDTEDVIFTLDRILDTGGDNSPLAVELRARIDRFAVVDALEFTVTLRKPDLRFPHKFFVARREGTLHVLPEHIWNGKPADFGKDPQSADFLEALIGTGPYVADTITSTEATFVRNEDWWGAKTGFKSLPEPEQVVVRFFETEEEAIEALKNDELDVGPEVDLKAYEDILSDNPYVIAWDNANPISWPGQCPRQLDFNTKKAPWDDALLRKAVANYIDQTEINSSVLAGQTYPSPTMFSAQPGLEPYIAAITAAGHGMPDTADASSGDLLMEQAGFAKGTDGFFEKDGKDLTLTIHVGAEPEIDSIAAQAIADGLTAAGLQTSVETVPSDELWAWILPPGDFEVVYSWLSCGSMVDPLTSLRRYRPEYAVEIGIRSPGYHNMARWDTEPFATDYGALLDKIEKMAPGDPKLLDLVVEAYAKLNEDMPFIPVVQNPRIVPFSISRWSGYPTAVDPYAIPKIEWGQFHQIVHNLTAAGVEK